MSGLGYPIVGARASAHQQVEGGGRISLGYPAAGAREPKPLSAVKGWTGCNLSVKTNSKYTQNDAQLHSVPRLFVFKAS